MHSSACKSSCLCANNKGKVFQALRGWKEKRTLVKSYTQPTRKYFLASKTNWICDCTPHMDTNARWFEGWADKASWLLTAILRCISNHRLVVTSAPRWFRLGQQVSKPKVVVLQHRHKLVESFWSSLWKQFQQLVDLLRFGFLRLHTLLRFNSHLLYPDDRSCLPCLICLRNSSV